MDLVITAAKRTFKFKYKEELIELADPNQDMSAENVMHYYAANYPVLTVAKVLGPAIEKDGSLSYKFVPTIGTKG